MIFLIIPSIQAAPKFGLDNEEREPKIILQGGLIDMINTLDEIKKEIPEGKYLKMMNIMKVMNDSLKKLPHP